MTDDSSELREMMREYQQGHFEAVDRLFAALAPVVRRYLIAHVRDGARADDLVQEVFLQLHRARHTYDAAYPVMPWVMAIARHVWLMDQRTRARRPWAPVDVTELDLPAKGEAAAYAVKADVQRALGQMAPSRRDAVIQHHVWGHSFKDIAEKAGITETAAKLRSSRGMAQLRALLKGHGAQKAPKA